MSDEVENNNPDIHLPVYPATRLTDEHNQTLRRVSKIPLVSVLITVVTLPLGLFNVAWVPTLNLIALSFAAFTVLSSATLFFFVYRARRVQQDTIQKAVDVMLPLVQKKYELDITEELLVSLMSGATLPLMVKGEVTRVALKNSYSESFLIKA